MGSRTDRLSIAVSPDITCRVGLPFICHHLCQINSQLERDSVLCYVELVGTCPTTPPHGTLALPWYSGLDQIHLGMYVHVRLCCFLSVFLVHLLHSRSGILCRRSGCQCPGQLQRGVHEIDSPGRPGSLQRLLSQRHDPPLPSAHPDPHEVVAQRNT